MGPDPRCPPVVGMQVYYHPGDPTGPQSEMPVETPGQWGQEGRALGSKNPDVIKGAALVVGLGIRFWNVRTCWCNN